MAELTVKRKFTGGRAQGIAVGAIPAPTLTIKRPFTGPSPGAQGQATTRGSFYLTTTSKRFTGGDAAGDAATPRKVQFKGRVTITGDSTVPAGEYD